MNPCFALGVVSRAVGVAGPPPDPVSSYVVLRLEFEGGSIVDTSSYGASMTVNGTAAQTSARAKMGSKSLRPGSTGYVSTPTHARYKVTGDWSIQCWLWSSTETPSFERAWGSSVGPASELLFISGAAYVIWRANDRFNVPNFFTGLANTWVHVYLAMVSNQLTLYRNGVAVGTWTNTAGYPSASTDDMDVGSGAAGNQPWQGDLDQFEYVIGAARWTADFIPPLVGWESPVFTYSNSVLRLPLNGTDAATSTTDVSASVKTITFHGDAQLDTAQSKWGGSSLLLDGTGDYIQTTTDLDDFRFGTGDFTLGCWIRTTATDQVVFDFYTSVSPGGYQLYINGSGLLEWYRPGSATITATGGAVNTGAWVYVAAARVGGVLKLISGNTVVASVADTVNYNHADVTVFAIGGQVHARAPTYDFAGHIDDVLVLKGEAFLATPIAAFPTS